MLQKMKARHEAPSSSIPAHLRKSKQKSQLKALYRTTAVSVAVCLFLLFGYYYFFSATSTLLPTSIPELQSLFRTLYGPFTGYYLTDSEKKKITELGGEYSYGEITLETSMKLLHDVFRVTERDVLYDLGSGIGKFIIQSYFFSNVSKAVGIELSPRRSLLATKAIEKLVEQSFIPPLALDQSDLTVPRKIALIEGNFLDHDLSDATLVYMCSTCFPDELLDKIYDKLVKECRTGLRVLTLAEFPDPDLQHFQLVDTIVLPMSWSNDTLGYLYEKI